MNSEEGDIILDCFFGTGSLYIACKNTNRKCIGIELCSQHVELALERINNI